MTSVPETLRADLVAALREASPTADTLCAGWTAHDLAAHLVARERRADSTPGLLLRPLAGWTERVRQRYTRRPYPELIEKIASGPPWTSPFALPGVDAAVNLAEHVIHTEDVRRARPGWQPREITPEVFEAVWSTLRRRGGLLFRGAPVAVILALPDGRQQAVAGDGPHVTVTGDPVDLLLYASGRSTAARVSFTGSPEAVQLLQGMRLGL